MFFQNHNEISEHDNCINSLLIVSVHDSICFPHSDIIFMYQNNICYFTTISMQISIFSQNLDKIRDNMHRSIYLTIDVD